MITNHQFIGLISGNSELLPAEVKQVASSIHVYITKNGEELSKLDSKFIKKTLKQFQAKYFDIADRESRILLKDLVELFKEAVTNQTPNFDLFASTDPLYMAVVTQNEKAVLAQLASGRSASLKYKHGETLLFAYMYTEDEKQNPEILKLLLESSALSAVNGFDRQFLIGQICQGPSQDVLLQFLSSQNEPIKGIADGIFRAKAFEFFSKCLDANVPFTFSQYSNPWEILIENEQWDLISKLSLSPCSPKNTLDKAFQWALDKQNFKGIEILIKAGAQLGELSYYSISRYYENAYETYKWVIKQLGQKVTTIKWKEDTLLHQIVTMEVEDEARWLSDLEELMQLGLSPTHKGWLLETPLEKAKKRGLKSAVQLFIKHLGKDPENSPLHEAILSGDQEEIKELLKTKNYFCCKNSLEQTPFDLIIETNQIALVPLFIPYCDFGANTVDGLEFMGPFISDSPKISHEMASLLNDMGLGVFNDPLWKKLFSACKKNDLAAVKAIAAKYPWLLSISIHGKSPLLKAVKGKALDVVQFLCENGVSIYGNNKFVLESSPLFAALLNGPDSLCQLLLNFHPELGTLEEISNGKSPFYGPFTSILKGLIEQKNLNAIFFLASHPKTKEVVLREGILHMIENQWNDPIELMIKKGFDLNGVAKGPSDRIPKSALTSAIFKNNIPLIQKILDFGALFEPYQKNIYLVPLNPLMAAILTKQSDLNLILYLIEVYQIRNHQIPWDILTDVISYYPKDDRLIFEFLKNHTTLTEAENKILTQQLQGLLFDPHLEIARAAFGLLYYGKTYLKTLEEWTQFVEEAKKFATSLDPLFPKTPELSGMALHFFSQADLESEVAKLMNQIFYHILCGMNSALNQDPQIISKIAKLLLNVKLEMHDKLLLALQTGSTLSEIESAIHYAEKAAQGIKPTADISLETEGWLNYFSVYRDRTGLNLCNQVLKKHKKSTNLVLKALQALERVGIARFSKTIENKQIEEIKIIIQTSKDLKVKNQACKTLWALSQDENDESLKQVLFNELLSLNLDKTNLFYTLTLIDLLGNYAYSESDIGQSTARCLRLLLNNKNSEVAFQAALTISKTNDKKGLLSCLKVLNSPVWNRHEDHFGKDTIHHAGSFLMFRQRPAHLHDNKHAVKIRILDRLASLEGVEFKALVQKQWAQFKKAPDSNPELKKFTEHFHNMPRTCTRFVGMPLFFPENVAIGRGLSARKGATQFYESSRDLIRKGCGTTDLTLETAEVAGQTWSRIGHIFASHNADLFFDHEGTYFYGSDSSFLVISSDYYNEEYMRGEARMELEHTFNSVWYRGIPKKHIQAIFFEQKNAQDFKLLASQDAIQTIQPSLTSPIFKDLSVKELVHLRRHLLAKDRMMVKGKPVELSFFDRIHYFDSTNKPPLPQKEVEAATGFCFPTEEDILEESLKRALARQIISKKVPL